MPVKLSKRSREDFSSMSWPMSRTLGMIRKISASRTWKTNSKEKEISPVTKSS